MSYYFSASLASSRGRKMVDDKSNTVQYNSHTVNRKTLPASWINDQDDDDDSALENVRHVDCVRKIEKHPTGSRKMTLIANTQPAGSLLICLQLKNSSSIGTINVQNCLFFERYC
ncbi:hypothetical protein T06_2115 [Trichinella sp. T6]|nr:hypothetical protein T06_2115 [Trichinella sp. T6]